MSEPTSRLPARPSLEQLRKQAKDLLRDVRAGAASSVHRVREVSSRLTEPTLVSEFTLADAQHVIAREVGFESWQKLVHHVETTHPAGLAKYDRLADEIVRAYMAGDMTAIREINWTNGTSFIWDRDPDRMRRRLSTWYQAGSKDMTLAIADARLLVAKQAGLDSWDELTRSLAGTSSRRGRTARDTTRNPLFDVDEQTSTIHVRGPISDGDWDAVFAVMKDMRLTALHGGGQMTDAALARLGRLHHVTSVDLSVMKKATAAGLRHLARLPIKRLDLGGWGTRVDDEMVAVLRDFSELRRISLMWAQHVSDTGVASLAGCEHLELVNLMGTPTGDGALRALTGKKKLSRFQAGTRVTPAGLRSLRDFPLFANPLPPAVLANDDEPTILELHPAPFVRGGLEALAGLDGIFSLRLFSLDRSIPSMTAAALAPVVRLGGLESFWCDASDEAMAVIATMPKLRALMCQDSAAGDDGWIALSASTTIERIGGRQKGRLTGRGFAALARIPSLRVLGLNLGAVDDASLSALPAFPALRDLTPVGLGDDAFRHIGRCTNLETLTCMYTAHIGDRAIEHLSGLRHLRRFYAGDTDITDRSLEVLGELPALESVELGGCPAITNAGLAALARAPRLRTVDLWGAPNVSRNAIGLFGPPVQVRIAG